MLVGFCVLKEDLYRRYKHFMHWVSTLRYVAE